MPMLAVTVIDPPGSAIGACMVEVDDANRWLESSEYREARAVITRVDVAPSGVAGWHTHPGDEVSYVMEGEATLMVAGQPPRKVAAGEGFVIPAGVVHNAKNDSVTAVKLVGVYVVEKGHLLPPRPLPRSRPKLPRAGRPSTHGQFP